MEFVYHMHYNIVVPGCKCSELYDGHILSGWLLHYDQYGKDGRKMENA